LAVTELVVGSHSQFVKIYQPTDPHPVNKKASKLASLETSNSLAFIVLKKN